VVEPGVFPLPGQCRVDDEVPEGFDGGHIEPSEQAVGLDRPDRGSLRADLAAVLAEIADSMTAPPQGTIPGLLADIHADPALRDRFDEKYLGAQRRTLTEILDRATARGELTARPDPAALNALLVGPAFAWLFLLSEAPGQLPALTSTVLEATLALIGPGPPSSRPAAGGRRL
jgi:hypothetical protein